MIQNAKSSRKHRRAFRTVFRSSRTASRILRRCLTGTDDDAARRRVTEPRTAGGLATRDCTGLYGHTAPLHHVAVDGRSDCRARLLDRLHRRCRRLPVDSIRTEIVRGFPERLRKRRHSANTFLESVYHQQYESERLHRLADNQWNTGCPRSPRKRFVACPVRRSVLRRAGRNGVPGRPCGRQCTSFDELRLARPHQSHSRRRHADLRRFVSPLGHRVPPVK